MSHSEVRQRQPSPPSSAKASSKEKKGPSSPPASNPQPATSASRGFILAASLALSVTLLFYLRTFHSLPQLSSYLLCSPPGTERIYTVDHNDSKVECMAVHGDFIIDTGARADLTLRYSSYRLIQINPGAIVVPGLTDSHLHALEYGAQRQIPMEDARNALEAVEHVSNYIKSDPTIYHNTSYFVEGWGWDHTRWPAKQWPTAEAMESDPITRGRPVVLQSKDGHALWVSQNVLDAMAPIPAHIQGGHIVRDEIGNPTGVFLDNAQELVPRPPPTEKQLLKRWSIMVKDAHAVGLTSIHDAALRPISLEFFERQAMNNNLPLRVYGMRYFDETGPYWGNSSAMIIGAGNDRLTSRSVKFFGDGALRSGGAALYEPYSDNPGTRGSMRLPAKVLYEIVPNFLRDGWQVNIHAIGDRANAIILDAFENALKNADVTALRPRLEHAQIMNEADIARLGKLGVIASVQPTHAISDMWYAETRLGPERVKGLYAFRSMVDGGARITLGSDAPVEDINPLAGFYSAITRVSTDGRSPHGPQGWFPEQRISRQEALRGITIDPAYASFTDNILGSIVPGKRADYVVFSQDIMEVPADQVLKTKVLATVMDGKAVYGAV